MQVERHHTLIVLVVGLFAAFAFAANLMVLNVFQREPRVAVVPLQPELVCPSATPLPSASATGVVKPATKSAEVKK